MQFGKVIYDVLSTDSDVISLVGNNLSGDGKRIFPVRVSYQEALPLIIYNIDNIDPTDDKDGVSTLDVIDFTVTIYAGGYAEIALLSQHVRDALDGYSGTNNGIVVDRVSFQDATDTFDQDAEKPAVFHEYSARVKR